VRSSNSKAIDPDFFFVFIGPIGTSFILTLLLHGFQTWSLVPQKYILRVFENNRWSSCEKGMEKRAQWGASQCLLFTMYY